MGNCGGEVWLGSLVGNYGGDLGWGSMLGKYGGEVWWPPPQENQKIADNFCIGVTKIGKRRRAEEPALPAEAGLPAWSGVS